MAAPVALSVGSAEPVACPLPRATLIEVNDAMWVRGTAIGLATLNP